jgi:hypothetical protein
VHTDFLLFCSADIRIFIDHAVKTVLKRIESAQTTLAEFLNTCCFGNVGPIQQLRITLGAASDANTSILAGILPAGYSGPAFPKKESEANILHLSRTADPHLVLGLGLLRRFDAQRNNPVPNQSPQCSWTGRPVLKGANRLDQYGPLAFEALYAVSSGLGGLFEQTVCSVLSPGHVPHAFKTKLTL